MSYSVLLADDHKIIRDGLRSLLSKQADMQVVAEASDGRSAVNLARELKPDIIVMDIAMPDLNGLEATRQILQDREAIGGNVKIIALSMQADGPIVRRMLEAGAAAYLLKDCAFEELIKATRAVLAGKTYLSADITNVIVRDFANPSAKTTSPLTAKEREVLQLIAEGKTTKEIAAALFVSVKTVETHRQHIMDKLDLHNVADLTRYAIREGVTTAEVRPKR